MCVVDNSDCVGAAGRLFLIPTGFETFSSAFSNDDCSHATEGDIVVVVGGVVRIVSDDRCNADSTGHADGLWMRECRRQKHHATAEQSGDREQTDHVRAGEKSVRSAGPTTERFGLGHACDSLKKALPPTKRPMHTLFRVFSSAM